MKRVLFNSLALAFLSLGALAGTGCESSTVSQCKQYGAAYCEYTARCAPLGLPADLLRQQCQMAFNQQVDCSQATITGDLNACLDGLQNGACTATGPAACQGAVTSPGADMSATPTCRFEPTGTAAEQAMVLAACPAGTTSAATADGQLKPDLDILFVIDNSSSMVPKQRVLGQVLPQFMQVIDAKAASYHIGVVTTDIGGLPSAGTPWNFGACASPAGDDGLLQNVPCSARNNVSPDARAVCNMLCPDARFVPNNGARYIEKKNGITNVPSAKDGMNNEVGPARALQCIGLIGDGGCGLESPLESAKRALDGHLMQNDGFLRPGSVLGLVFLTDEDDCSVQQARRTENDPMSKDCPADPYAEPSCYNADYRCLARSVQCDQPMNSAGTKTNCRERADSYLEPVSKYAQFLAALRPSGKRVVAGIWSPSLAGAPSGTGLGKLIVEADGGLPGSQGLNRGQRDKAACYDPTILTSDMKGFIGQAQLRLSSFAGKLSGTSEYSICDTAGYGTAINKIGDAIARSGTACLDKKPRLGATAQPLCLAGFVDAATPSATPAAALPQCGSSCCAAWSASSTAKADDPAIISACQVEAADCYCAVPSQRPDVCSGGAIAGVWTKAAFPAGKVASFRCVNQ